MGSIATYNEKKKVLFIMGSTGTGKTMLSLSIAQKFPSEIINADKIQFYKGLDIVTNKISESKRFEIPHHLLGTIEDPDKEFTSSDFCGQALAALADITERGLLPIIVGGSNNYLEALVEDHHYPNNAFRSKYDCCFLWLDVSLPVLFEYACKRVDEMAEAGLVEELREVFVPGADYNRGIRRAIGVPEFEGYLKAEKEVAFNESYKKELMEDAIKKTKENTCKLAEAQLKKIYRLKNELRWDFKRIDSTAAVFEAVNKEEKHLKLWNETVFEPSLKIVEDFLAKPDAVYKPAPIRNDVIN